jgi:cytochrome c5
VRKAFLLAAFELIVLVTVSVALRTRSSKIATTAFAAPVSNSSNAAPDFEKDVKPIFQARCQPCHFEGGQMYDKLPFDKSETITKLGTKLFTRIKDEKERRVIQNFLDASK